MQVLSFSVARSETLFRHGCTAARLGLLAALAVAGSLPAALAETNRTPKPSGSGMTCRCTCMSLGGAFGGEKNLNWTGSRSDCQSLSGTACKLDKPDSAGNNYGSSTGCDVILAKPAPKSNLKAVDPNAPKLQSN